MFTDLGIFIGHRLRGLPVNTRRLSLCLIIISGFLCGGIVGAYLFQKFAYATLFIPATGTGLAAVAYGVYQLRHQPRVRA
jgi:uncharacterized membrane protein YoaK (UPF0700 family)